MVLVSDTALKERARSMLVAMTERERWIYALPREGNFERIVALLEERAVPRVAEAETVAVARYEDERGQRALVIFDNAELDVVLIEGTGSGAVPLLQDILAATGFIAQSKLWASALDIGTPDSTTALAILAHQVVCWDDDWIDLFLLHLASPDAVVRRQAVTALTVAAMVSRAVEPALELLSEALDRERFPKLSETLREARRVLEAYDGRPISLADNIEA